MQAYTHHVSYQLPNEHTRLGYILDARESTSPPLITAMANIEEDTASTGKRNNFETDIVYLLPKDPVVKRRPESGTKRTQLQISDTTVADFSAKVGIEKSGVHLRWQKTPE